MEIRTEELDVRQSLAALEARIALLEQARLEQARTVPNMPAIVPMPIAAAPITIVRPDAFALEHQLGSYWLSRVGILSLISGIALVIITYFGELGTLFRIVLGYSMAGTLAWAGLRLSRNNPTFGRVVFGGGLAIGYFVTYALHFVRAMQVIHSETIGVILVALAICAIVVIAHRMKSETVAGIALFLGLHTGMLSDVTALALVCMTLLAVGAGFLLVANRWVIVPLSTVFAVYTLHGSLVTGAGALPAMTTIAFIAIAFAIFAAASLARRDVPVQSLVALTLLNWLGAVGLGGYVVSTISHAALFAYLLVAAGVHLAIAAIAQLRRSPSGFAAIALALAIGTAAMALPAQLAGWSLAIGWLVLAVISGGIARRTSWFVWIAVALLVVAHGPMQSEHLGVMAELASVAAIFVVERIHAARDRGEASRLVLIIALAMALLRVAHLAVPAGMHTIAAAGVAFIMFAIGFILKLSTYRWSAFAILALAALRLLADLQILSANGRIVTFVAAGVLLLVVSYIYTRSRKLRRG